RRRHRSFAPLDPGPPPRQVADALEYAGASPPVRAESPVQEYGAAGACQSTQAPSPRGAPGKPLGRGSLKTRPRSPGAPVFAIPRGGSCRGKGEGPAVGPPQGTTAGTRGAAPGRQDGFDEERIPGRGGGGGPRHPGFHVPGLRASGGRGARG